MQIYANFYDLTEKTQLINSDNKKKVQCYANLCKFL